ncbi:hypothetical protein JXD20_04090 [Candidatus Peregrinibacteria bacterium]|nr:hypothetical protein [Candidatus Peregrinibacteria bacterium]
MFKLGKFVIGLIGLTAALISIGTFVWPHKDTITSFAKSQGKTVEKACGYAGTIGLDCK